MMSSAATRAQPVRKPRFLRKISKEFEVHCMVADLLRFALLPGWIWWHTPNGEERNKATAGRLKRMGVMPGVSDFLLLSPVGDLYALELKRQGRKPTDDQEAFLDAVYQRGGYSAWVDNFDDAVKALETWNCLRTAR